MGSPPEVRMVARWTLESSGSISDPVFSLLSNKVSQPSQPWILISVMAVLLMITTTHSNMKVVHVAFSQEWKCYLLTKVLLSELPKYVKIHQIYEVYEPYITKKKWQNTKMMQFGVKSAVHYPVFLPDWPETQFLTLISTWASPGRLVHPEHVLGRTFQAVLGHLGQLRRPPGLGV